MLIIDGNGYCGSACIRPSVNGSGNVGVSNCAFKEVWSYYHATPSDSRQKENIRDIDSPLDLIMKIKGVKYDIKKVFTYNNTISDSKLKTNFEKERKNKVGFLAQDVEKVLPEIVFHDDSTDTYGIDYSKIVPVLVEAIKEQQVLIEELSKDLKKVKKDIKGSNTNKGNNSIIDEAILYQNTPNPFDKSTVISYYLPESIQKATLNIYDMQGNPKKEIPIYDHGRSSVTISATTLYQGMYMYTLIADGVEVDTKRMILTGNN